MNHEDKLISNNWMEFLTCMEVAGRDLEMLTLTLNGISNVKKQAMELKGGTSESRNKSWNLLSVQALRSKLRSILQNNQTPKVVVKELREEKKRQWKNNRKREFVMLVEKKEIMIVVIVPPKFLLRQGEIYLSNLIVSNVLFMVNHDVD